MKNLFLCIYNFLGGGSSGDLSNTYVAPIIPDPGGGNPLVGQPIDSLLIYTYASGTSGGGDEGGGEGSSLTGQSIGLSLVFTYS